MKIFYEYSTHNPNFETEYWVRIREEGETETELDFLSPINKIEASLSIKLFPSDTCQFEIISASRGKKLEPLQQQYKDEFFLIIKNRDGKKKLISKTSFKWEELIKKMEKYKEMLFDSAVKISNSDFYLREQR